MSKVKTRELTGNALNWAVAKCLTLTGQVGGFTAIDGQPYVVDHSGGLRGAFFHIDWSQGGPVMDLETMEVLQKRNPDSVLCRVVRGVWQEGPTILVAAMRAFVHERLGEDVEVPEELL